MIAKMSLVWVNNHVKCHGEVNRQRTFCGPGMVENQDKSQIAIQLRFISGMSALTLNMVIEMFT